MRAGTLLVIIVVIAAAVGVGIMVQKKNAAATPPTPAGPPADAQFIPAEMQPGDVVGSIMRKNAGTSQYIGMWIPEPGWDMGVDDMEKASDGGWALKQYRAEHAGALGGGYWLLAGVPFETEVKKGDHVFISGKIEKVESYNDGGITPAYRIVVRPAKAISNTKR
jgi:hypothetical protein